MQKSSGPQTLSEKVWEQHVVHRADGEPDLLYIDLHLVHEVTSPQAFDGLRMNGRGVRRPELTVATMDHNVPTIGLELGITDPISRKQIETLADELRGVRHPPLRHGRSGPGHRARHRPRAGPDPAGHDDRLRRQPHVDARRVRSARVRHRHERGRARPRDPDPPPAAPGHDGDHRRGRPARRCHREGRRPVDHRPDRHRRRDRLGHRVPRVGRSGRSRWRAA